MKRSAMALAAAVVVLAACKKQEQQAAAPADTVFRGLTIEGFNTPESVLYDSVGDAYLVSNINGAPTVKDDNGFISRVNPDGHVEQLRFIDGAKDSVTLNAPKGLGIHGDTLFVADIDEVRLFDRMDGHSLGSWPVHGATFLNDLTVGPDGTVYVTDSGLKPDFSSSGTDAVYKFDHGRAVAIARGADLGHPNGIFATEDGLTVVTFGSGEAYHLTYAGQRHPMARPPAGQLDGVLRSGGRVIASSWADSSVFAMTPPDTTWTFVARGLESPADIGLDTRRGRLLIPQFNVNRVLVRPLAR